MKNIIWLLATVLLFALSAQALPSRRHDELPPTYDEVTSVREAVMPAQAARVHLVGNNEMAEDTDGEMWHDTTNFPLSEEAYQPRGEEEEVAVQRPTARQNMLYKLAAVNYIRAHILLTVPLLFYRPFSPSLTGAKRASS